MKKKRRTVTGNEEVVTARDKFKGALQDLLPRSDDETDSEEESWITKKKMQLEGKLKRRQMAERAEADANKFIMKLFDRSVDLAQFNENTPLYPICRAWIANQPNLIYSVKKEKEVPDLGKNEPGYVLPKDIHDLDAVRDTYKLPPPELKPSDSQSVRLPSPVSYVSPFDVKADDEPPSKEDLLADNLKHWGKVRKSWLDASANNEERYEKSLRILTAMFNKAQNQFLNG